MTNVTTGFALCGSFCTLKRAIAQLEILKQSGMDIIPIMSPAVYNTDTRFGKAQDFINQVEQICKNKIINTIEKAEPIGPKKLLDIIIVAPCTGNTLSKLALGITDTCVTMAVKAHLRNGRPVLLAVATNDALSGCARNIGLLYNTKNIYFTPLSQDDAAGKPTSLVCDFEKIPQAAALALAGKQMQPILL